jgi:signal transduction histidine kinase
MRKQSQIVIGPDGMVLAASGEVPPDLIDQRLDDCVSLSPAVRAAGKTLVHQLRASRTRVVSHTVELDSAGTSLQIVAIEALAIHRTSTDVRSLLTSKLAIVSSQAEAAGVSLSVEVADNVPALVNLDSEKVAWAVTTLVGNALRYVHTPSRRLGGRAIHVRASFDEASSEVTIEIRDDGPGIPEATVRRLFVRDAMNVRGSGLALLLVRDIVIAHGGHVDLSSSTAPVDHGTTIRLTFPAP